MIARGDVATSKICVVPNGIHQPNPELLLSVDSVRRELNVPQDAPLLVCVARLEREKGINSLIEAIPLVHHAFPETYCAIAGSGSLKDQLTEQIQNLQLQEKVHLVGFYSDVLSLINAADLFILPSPAEPFGLVLLEAMALAKPVVACRAGGPKEIVQDGKTGLLSPPNDSSAMSDAIIQLLNDVKKRQVYGQCGYERFQESYTAEKMVENTLKTYQQAMQS